jgi:hypothetical protein
MSNLTVTVNNNAVQIKEGSLKMSSKLNQIPQVSFTIIDPAGTAQYSKGQPVSIVDSVQGTIFAGFLIDPVASNLTPQPANLWTCNSIADMTWLASKRTSHSLYANQYGGVIVADQIQQVLAQEGIFGNFALDFNHFQTDWTTGATFTNTSATGNAGDGNAGDGDLELALAGSIVSKTEKTTSAFSSGTLHNVAAANNMLSLASMQAIKLTGTASTGYGNQYVYFKIWAGSYSIASGDTLQYDVWISSTSPQIEAGVDGICSDGQTLRDFTYTSSGNTHKLVDQQGFNLHPSSDLSGFANDQWYSRSIDLSSLPANGHGTLSQAMVALEGDSQGQYTAYFRNIRITNGGTTRLTIFSNSLNTNVQLQTLGYEFPSVTTVVAYDQYGYRISPATSIASVGIVQSSTISYTADVSAVGTVLTVQSSFDGGVTWQTLPDLSQLLSTTPIPNLPVGMNTSGVSIQTKISFAIVGPSPEASPTLSAIGWTVNPAYACTKTDAHLADNFSGGSNSNLQVVGGDIYLWGYWRNWDDANTSNQTTWSSDPGGTTPLLQGQQLCTCAHGNDARCQLNFVGNWQDFTVELDVQVPVAGCNSGIVYRTTNWANGSNSFAYNAAISPTLISLGYGANNNSGTTFTTVASQALTLNPGDVHRLKVVVSGSSHKVYLDEVLYLNATDSTYTASGGVGLRFWNNASDGLVHSGFFDNFGIVQSLTGTHTSAALAIGSVGTIENSVVQWDDDLPAGATLTIQTSTDLSTWHVCTNGAAIPNFGPGVNPAGGTNLYVQAILTMQNAASIVTVAADGTQYMTGVLHGVTLWLASQPNASGTWVSPALSLSSVGRAGAALVNWNANTPAHTSVAAATSIDGGSTWQSVVSPGSGISGINTQPVAFVDLFTSNDSASYTESSFTGGGPGYFYISRAFGSTLKFASAGGNWTWDTPNSRVYNNSGTNATLIYNTAWSQADNWIQAIFDQADNSGIITNYQNANNSYFVRVWDSQGASNQNLLRLYKRSSGSNTQLGSDVTINFVRGTWHIVKLDVQGGVLTVFFDGVQVLQYTDISPLAAGKFGLLENGLLRCYQIWAQAYGDSLSGKSVKLKFTLTSTDPTQTPQVLDSAVFVSDGTIGPGILDASDNYQDTYCSANIDDQNKKANYAWTVLPSRQLTFQAQTAVPAPWVVQTVADSNTANVQVKNLTMENGGDLYRNRMKLKGVQATKQALLDVFGDTKSTSWTLTYPIAQNSLPPTITLNGQKQSVGILGIDTGKNFYYQIGSTTITQDSGGTVLGYFDELVVQYIGAYTTTVTIDNTGVNNPSATPYPTVFCPGTVTQAQYQAILDPTGTGYPSGIVEAVEDVSAKNMDVAAATAYATSLLQRYGVIGRILSFMTLKSGLQIGQQLAAFITPFAMNNAQLLITQIDIVPQTTMQNGVVNTLYWYSVVASEAPALDSWQKVFNGLLT